jgi:ribonuclease Z
MDCILLGTGGMAPLPYRLLTSLAVRLNGRIYVFDAGEGAQLGWKAAQLGLRGFGLLAVTHLHADHCLGIPGLLMFRAQMDDPGSLTILGPPGIASFLKGVREALGFVLNFPLEIVEWSDTHGNLAYLDDRVRIFWQPLKHTRFCLGYRMEEHERPGKFNPGRAMQLGIPKGTLWGKLQSGQEIVLESGSTIKPDQVLGPGRRGRHIAYVVDTRPTKAIYGLCRDVDLAFVEGMFLAEDAHHAEVKGHLTAVDAARLARRAGARRAILVHISPRYSEEDLVRLQNEALETFGKALVGSELGVYSVPYEDE